MDETFVRIAGRWMYLFRAVDGGGQTVDFYLWETRDREAAKLFLKRALGGSVAASHLVGWRHEVLSAVALPEPPV